jgi:putative transposase
MILNEIGQIAYDEWIKLPNRYSNMELNVFQIMPNHLHAIVQLNDCVREISGRAGTSPAPTVGMIV